jgi:hypothetical protein
MDEPYADTDMLQGFDLIARCRRVDQALSHWHEFLPPDWQPIYVDHKPIAIPEDDDLRTIMAWAAGERICIYRDQWMLFHQSTLMIYRYFLQAFILSVGARMLGCTVHDIANDDIDKREPLYSMLVQAKEAILGLLDRSCRSVYHVSRPSQFLTQLTLAASWLVTNPNRHEYDQVTHGFEASSLCANHPDEAVVAI